MALFVARSNLKCFRQQIVSISPLTTSLRHKLSGKAGAEPVKSASVGLAPSLVVPFTSGNFSDWQVDHIATFIPHYLFEILVAAYCHSSALRV
ncbi:NADH:ubiquinone oxidoreductase subunit V3 isoform X2 [Tachypleus tridentatus]|uniref:NADH:ubiquinone oxidoreductase subunit V3 isoform X2 n=1 Tax=Tachypleus tridentatus TaxID=6853 RepID=UPI003FD26F1A